MNNKDNFYSNNPCNLSMISCSISSFVIYFGMLLLVLLTNGLVAENLRATYVIIGIALMVSSLVVALYCLFLWFVKRKTHLKQNKFK